MTTLPEALRLAEGWTDERIAACWQAEVRARFEAENAEWRAEEQRFADANPDAHWFEMRDSFLWEVFEGCTISIDNNLVRVVFPQGFAIDRSALAMFDSTEVAWSTLSLDAETVDGEPRLVGYVTLIDYWDDERSAAWHARTTLKEQKP